MKKRLLFVAAIFAATATFAQDGLTSKKGEAYLPEAGDWALGFGGNQFLDYVGNMANGTTGNSMSFTNGGAIYGKMFKDEKTAYRVMFELGFSSATTGATQNLYSNPSDLETKEFTDETKVSKNQIALGFGLEKRRGNTRIQGIYGAMLSINFGGQTTTNTYGLAYSDSTINANAGNNGTTESIYANGRNTEVKAGSTFGLGIYGFAGVEWFFAPKFSLGAEYRWGLNMTSTGESETTSESWGTAPGAPALTPNSLQTKTAKGGKSSTFGFGPLNTGNAVVMINFHF